MTTTPRLSKAQRQAMRLGWRASQHGQDLDAAEGRYIGRHGSTLHDEWLDGWMDVSIGREFGQTYTIRTGGR